MSKVINILLLLVLTACAVNRTAVEADTITIERVIVRDSIVIIPADSSFIEAYFECDSLNRVVMTQLNEVAGNNINSVTKFDTGTFIVNSIIDTQFVYLNWSERNDTTIINTVSVEEVEKIVYEKPSWLMWLAGLGSGAIIVLLLLIFLKKIK